MYHFNHFSVYNSVALSTFTVLLKCRDYLFPEFFHPPKARYFSDHLIHEDDWPVPVPLTPCPRAYSDFEETPQNVARKGGFCQFMIGSS